MEELELKIYLKRQDKKIAILEKMKCIIIFLLDVKSRMITPPLLDFIKRLMYCRTCLNQCLPVQNHISGYTRAPLGAKRFEQRKCMKALACSCHVTGWYRN